MSFTLRERRICALVCLFALVFGASGRCFASGSIAGNIVKNVPNGEMKIALTFDDGPHCKYTAEILDILKEYNVKATFFVIGSNASKYPELIERELCEGHEVENHTYSHVYLKKLSDDEIKNQLAESESVVTGIADYTTRLIRPPGGIYDDRLLSIASELGYGIVLWSVDTRDWEHKPPAKIIECVLRDVCPGDIILMHDFIGRNSPTPEALRVIIPRLKEMGYSFVTVSELMELGEPCE